TGDCAATGARSAKPIRHTAHNLILLRKSRMYNPGFVSQLLSLLTIAEAIVTPPPATGPSAGYCFHFARFFSNCMRCPGGGRDSIPLRCESRQGSLRCGTAIRSMAGVGPFFAIGGAPMPTTIHSPD